MGEKSRPSAMKSEYKDLNRTPVTTKNRMLATSQKENKAALASSETVNCSLGKLIQHEDEDQVVSQAILKLRCRLNEKEMEILELKNAKLKQDIAHEASLKKLSDNSKIMQKQEERINELEYLVKERRQTIEVQQSELDQIDSRVRQMLKV